MVADDLERQIATSGVRIDDPRVEGHLKELACRLSPAYCAATRVYLLRTPEFNAAMFPNGMMVVFSGLLIRVYNDAQLASVLGHEIGHYQRRHLIARYRNAKAWMNALTVLLYAGGGVGGNAGLGAVTGAQLIAIGAIAKYSRDNESEADAIGLTSLADAGFDPREAAKVWRNLLHEEAVDPDKRLRVPILESHPAEETRMRALEAAASERLTPELEGATGKAEYRAAVGPLLPTLLADEITMRRPQRSQAVLSRLNAEGLLNEAQLAYERAEIARLRDGPGDVERAIVLYDEALRGDDVPPIAERNLGLLLRRTGDALGAREALGRYLELVPDAPDRAMIDSYLKELSE